MSAASSYNLIGTGGSGGLVNGVNHNQVGVANPGLGTLAQNGGPTRTVALLPGSPAIDRGSNAFVTAGETDQRGLTRVANGTVDIGAFEVQTTSVVSASVAGVSSTSPTTAAGGTLPKAPGSPTGMVNATVPDSSDDGLRSFAATLADQQGAGFALDLLYSGFSLTRRRGW